MKYLLLALPLALMTACAAPSSQGTADAPATTQTTAAATFDNAALSASHWELSDARDQNGERIEALFARQDKPITLDFQRDRLSVRNACNVMGGTFTLAGDQLSVGSLMSTMMACTDAKVAALDGAIGSRLEGKLQLRRTAEDGMTLTTASGDVLSFVGVPTAETRYGGEGERVFLEVAAQTKPCSHPLIPNAQCLQTREVRYDERGLEQGTRGAYENFYGNIEGYTHQPGTRNVLRLKRFNVQNPPADGASVAYVLDMVVESGIED